MGIDIGTYRETDRQTDMGTDRSKRVKYVGVVGEVCG